MSGNNHHTPQNNPFGGHSHGHGFHLAQSSETHSHFSPEALSGVGGRARSGSESGGAGPSWGDDQGAVDKLRVRLVRAMPHLDESMSEHPAPPTALRSFGTPRSSVAENSSGPPPGISSQLHSMGISLDGANGGGHPQQSTLDPSFLSAFASQADLEQLSNALANGGNGSRGGGPEEAGSMSSHGFTNNNHNSNNGGNTSGYPHHSMDSGASNTNSSNNSNSTHGSFGSGSGSYGYSGYSSGGGGGGGMSHDGLGFSGTSGLSANLNEHISHTQEVHHHQHQIMGGHLDDGDLQRLPDDTLGLVSAMGTWSVESPKDPQESLGSSPASGCVGHGGSGSGGGRRGHSLDPVQNRGAVPLNGGFGSGEPLRPARPASRDRGAGSLTEAFYGPPVMDRIPTDQGDLMGLMDRFSLSSATATGSDENPMFMPYIT